MQLFPNGLAKTILPQGTQGLSAALQTASPFLLGMSQGVREGTPWRGANVGLANMMVAQEREQAEAEKRREAAEKQQALALSRGMLSDIFQPAAPVDTSNPFAVTEPQGIANATMAALGREPMAGSALPASLVQSESGGRFSAMNDVPGAGGVGHFGRGQFSRARLNEAMAAGVIPQGMTPEQFLQSPEAQQRVEAWHVQDVGNFIREQGLDRYIGQTINGTMITPSGMLAVAHLGGKEGLRRFIETGGQYNPSDANGTSLMDYLRQHGGGREPIDPDRAAAIMTSPHVPAAVKQMVLQQMQGPSPAYEYIDGVGMVDMNNPPPELMAGQFGTGDRLTDDQLASLNTIRDDARNDFKEFELSRSGFEVVETAFKNPGGVSDYALTVAFAKILDPTSVVREGEQAAIARTGAVPEAVKAQLQNALTGEGMLPPRVRNEIMRLSVDYYNRRAEAATEVWNRYQDLARRAGVPEEFAYMQPRPEVYSGEVPEPFGAPAGGTPAGGAVAEDAMQVLQATPPPMPTPPRPVQLDDGRQYSPEQVSAAAAKLTPGQRATFERMTGLPDMIEYLRRVGALQ